MASTALGKRSTPAGRAESLARQLVAARKQAAEEARRLARPIPAEAARRDALDDLATRLEALARHLDSVGVDASALRSIVGLLRDKTLPTAERWEHARQALREFADGETSAGRPFWKRH